VVTWSAPAAGRITSPYGPRVLAGAIGDYHFGVDMSVGVAVKTPVYAVAAGTVRTVWQTVKGAWVVDIRHSSSERTRYIHMERGEILVATGQRVSQGQRIGTTGRSGASSVHLHFETMLNDILVNPVPYMAARGVWLGVTPAGNPGGGPGVPNLPDVDVDPPDPIAPKPAQEEPDMLVYRAQGSRGFIFDGWTYTQGPDGILRPLTAREWGAIVYQLPETAARVAVWSADDLYDIALRCGMWEFVGTAADRDPKGFTGRIIGRNAPIDGSEPRGGSDARHTP
jgi:hypothetical protein